MPNCDCSVGFYDDGSTSRCQLCDYRCYECSAQTQCRSCNSVVTRRQLNIINSMCECADRYYQPANSLTTLDPVCRPCHHSCQTCNHDTVCLTCELANSTRVFNNGRCLCSLGFYDDGSSSFCLKCSYKCRTCAVASSCSSCDSLSNRRFSTATGLCECLRGFYDAGDGVDSRCYSCLASCYECTSNSSCSACPPLSNRYINTSEGTGECICLYGYY